MMKFKGLNITYKLYLTLMSIVLINLELVSQIPLLEHKDFRRSGQTISTGDDCYRLTSARDWSSGSLWYKTPIDLAGSFEMELNLMFGCKDEEGADGIVFVFSPYSQLTGFQGEGMGFAGLQPSLGIEIDTWYNGHLGDPYEDHIAILQNGRVRHSYNLAGPIVIKNVEDCLLHKLLIRWNHLTQTLKVHLDGSEVIAYTGNIIRDLFLGNSEVYWGVTAATGKFNNIHEICFQKLSFSTPPSSLKFNTQTTKELLKCETVTLRNLKYQSGSSVLLKESIPDLQRLVNFLKKHHQDIEIHGHTDNQGDEKVNAKLSLRRAKAVADFLIRNGIDKNRIHLHGHGEYYPIADNDTPLGRQKNRRVDIRIGMRRA